MKIIVYLLLNLLPMSIFAQADPLKSPKQKSLQIGGHYIYSTIYKGSATIPDFTNQAIVSPLIAFDYAWQVSGFNAKRAAAYISVPIAYIPLYGKSNSKFDGHILTYGWTVRHELLRSKKFIPYLGYALMLSSLKYKDMPGSIFGHCTAFQAGLNYNPKPHFVPFAQIQYTYTRYPRLGDNASYHVQALETVAGIRF